jgi:hypothetical protein
VISASGFGSDAIAAEPGPHSFTTALVTALSRLCHYPLPFSDSELHTCVTSLLQSEKAGPKKKDGKFIFDSFGKPYFEPERRQSPVILRLTEKSTEPIFLTPLPPVTGGTTARDKMVLATEDHGEMDVLFVLRLTTDTPDLQPLAKYFAGTPQAGPIKIIAAFKSRSTVLIMRVSSTIWTLLSKHRALSFISYVEGDDMVPVLIDPLEHGEKYDRKCLENQWSSLPSLSDGLTANESGDINLLEPSGGSNSSLQVPLDSETPVGAECHQMNEQTSSGTLLWPFEAQDRTRGVIQSQTSFGNPMISGYESEEEHALTETASNEADAFVQSKSQGESFVRMKVIGTSSRKKGHNSEIVWFCVRFQGRLLMFLD